MHIERVYTPGLAQVAYLVGDEQAGVAAVIDPRRDIDLYLELARAAGLRITDVFETHVHADFVSGALEVAAATGATLHASRSGALDYPHHALDDGDEVEIGGLRVRALHTPGHTPEHLCFFVTDPQGEHGGSAAPPALFTGDMLFVGEVGRPDLLGQDATDTLAGQLFDSVQRLRELPDTLLVYPGHGAGSACGKRIGDSPSTTIGQEKLVNYAFQIHDRAAFKRAILDGMPPAPTYYPILKRVNKVGAPLLATLPPARLLAVGDVEQAVADGALLLDTRSPAAFGGAHIPGALFAGLGPNFTAWLGWLAPYERDLVLVLERDEDLDEALTQLRRIGLDRVPGALAGGLGAWLAAGQPIATLPQIDARTLAQRLADGELRLLDVRSADEWAGGHIGGAAHRFAGEIARAWEAPPPAPNGSGGGGGGGAPLAVICGSGYRSSVAASVLRRAGRDDLVNVIGGMEAWNAAGLQTVTD